MPHLLQLWHKTAPLTFKGFNLGEGQLKGCAQWGRQRSCPRCSTIYIHVHSSIRIMPDRAASSPTTRPAISLSTCRTLLPLRSAAMSALESSISPMPEGSESLDERPPPLRRHGRSPHRSSPGSLPVTERCIPRWIGAAGRASPRCWRKCGLALRSSSRMVVAKGAG